MTNPYIGTRSYKTNEIEHDYDLTAKRIVLVGNNYDVRIAEDSGDSDITYIGKAAKGSATSSAVWQIKKIDKRQWRGYHLGR